MAEATVLVADDDAIILELVATLLDIAGYRVIRAADGQAAVRALFERHPDLVVLDLGMPTLNGWQVLERIREVSDVPVLMLTAQSDELDKVRGLRAGADDFVTKPFGRQELLARVEALLRRRRPGGAAKPAVSIVGRLTVDHDQRLAKVGEDELRLTPLEFRLLSAMASNARQLLSGDRLVELVWDDDYIAPEQVKVLVGRLRRKLQAHFAEDPIETVRGFGYRLKIEDA